MAQFGVTVNAVCLGYVDTPMTEASIRRFMEKTGRSREQVLAAILETTPPQRRLFSPEEVAEALLSLCGKARWVSTGMPWWSMGER